MASTDGSAESIFRDWLRIISLSGCNFASRLAGDPEGLAYFKLLGLTNDVAANVADLLDQAGETHRAAVLLFPTLRDDEQIAGLVRVLHTHPRWAACIVADMGRDDRELGIELSWTTATGAITHAMGFAPSGYMPVTRRAPFVALAAWTGGHENPRHTNFRQGFVTLGDVPPPDLDSYDRMFGRTQAETKRLLGEDVGQRALRRLAFRLPRRVVEAELSDLPTSTRD